MSRPIYVQDQQTGLWHQIYISDGAIVYGPALPAPSSPTDPEYLDFYDFMLLELPGCPKAILLQHLKEAFRQFSGAAENWIEKCEDIDVVADQQDYTIPITPTETIVKRIREVKYNGAVVPTNQYDLVNNITFRWRTDYIPTEAVTDGLDIEVAMIPELDSDYTDGTYFARWFDAIKSRAFYTLMMMPRKEWTQPDKAGIYNQEYKTKLTEAIRERYTENKAGNLKISLSHVQGVFA